jgi:hypothetical protein
MTARVHLVDGARVTHLYRGQVDNQGWPRAMCWRRLLRDLPLGDPKATRCKVCMRRYMEILDPEVGVSVPEVMGWDCGKACDELPAA